MSILPAIAFAVLATVVLYTSVRGYRRLFPSTPGHTSSKSASLPAPVVGKSSTWAFPKINLKGGWTRRLSLSGIPRVRVRVPWSRSSSLDSGVAPKTKNSKNLGIELLPTTGLPPHPSSLPTPTPTPTPTPSASHVLVDVSVSAPPPASIHPSSAPGTPRPPSPPFPGPAPSSNYFSGAKALLLPLHHHSRPPSPHALLVTTTPPKNHKRSRSLGGVPVRRLSSGAGSALRHAVGVDVGMEMDDLGVRNGHVRDTSREHLLIDFSSSSSPGRGRGEVEDDPDISPAASDIGVLSMNAPLRTRSESTYGYGYEMPVVALSPQNSTPIAVLPKQVARQVPLVDLEEEDDSWKWFSEAPVVASAVLPSLPSARALMSSKALTNSVEMKPLGSKMEKLVDLDEPVELKARAPELVSEVKLIDVEERNYEEGILIDVSEKPMQIMPQAESVIVAPKTEETTTKEAHEDVPLPMDAADQEPAEPLEDPFADPPLPVSPHASSSVDVADDPFADPRPALVVHELPSSPPSGSVALSTEQDMTVSTNESLPPTLEGSSEMWSWQDSHDPWHGHTSDVDPIDTVQQSEVERAPEAPSSHDDSEILGEASSVEQDAAQADLGSEEALLEHSPAGVLVPTVVDDDEEGENIPPLDLYVEEQKADKPSKEHKDDEADDDTPKATPASLTQELPPWSPLEALPIDEDDFYGSADEASDVEAQPAPVSPGVLSTTLDHSEHDDPGLLDLPLVDEPIARAYTQEEATYYGPTAEEISLVLNNPGGALFSLEKPSGEDMHLERGDGQHTPTKTPLAQTPTPPASPPPPSHNLALSTRALKFGSNHNSCAVSPVALSVPALVLSKANDNLDMGVDGVRVSKSPVGVKASFEDDKENIAPALSSKSSNSEDNVEQTRPAWSVRAQDAPALGVPSAGYVLGTSPRSIRRALSSESHKVNIPAFDEEVKPAAVETSKETHAPEPVVDVALVEITTQVEDMPSVNDPLPEETQPAVVSSVILSDALPGTFPEPASISKVEVASPSGDDTPSSPTGASSTAVSITATTTLPTRRRALTGAIASTLPSVRRLVRSPLDVALAMQLRPGLGAGADPAWMVRFLMAMYGWLAVVIAGQDF